MLLSLRAAAQELGGVSLPTLRRQICAGELPVIRLGRRVFIARAAIEAFVERHAVASGLGTKPSAGELRRA